MPSFKYIAFDKKGRKNKGIIEAPAQDIAYLTLQKKGLYPHTLDKIEKKKKHTILSKIFSYFQKITQRERADLFFQLATMIKTGIPLTDSLYVCATQTEKNKLKEALLKVKDKISEGQRFSEAAKEEKEIFTETYIRMIEIAEKTGRLADILFKISEREENRSSFNQQIAPIILYPLFVMIFGLGIVIFLLSYVVPKMEKIFISFKKELPVITKALIYVGLFFKKYLISLLITFCLIIISINLLYIKSIGFRKKIDEILLKISIYRKILITQFTSNLSFQLESGIQFTEAIINSAKAVNNLVFQEKMLDVVEEINAGKPIDNVFLETKLFDNMFIASLSTGKKSGAISDFIKRMSIYYEKKLNNTIKTFISILEPLSILILGTVVGFIVMSIMVPLFSISEFVK